MNKFIGESTNNSALDVVSNLSLEGNPCISDYCSVAIERLNSVSLETLIINWRHFLHKNPEIGFEENLTSNFIAEKLEEFGIEVHRKYW